MSKLILLRGNSGSGKTTVARQLQKALGRGTLLLSQDVVRREMLWARDGPDTAALPLLMDLLRYGRDHCAVVILEGILNAEWYRPLLRLARDLYGEGLFAYYYDLPFEETLRRHQTRESRQSFGAAEMRGWWREKDWAGLFPEKALTRELSPEDAVALILSDVTGGREAVAPPPPPPDPYAYQLGAADCFCEMVRAGVKRVALSHPCETRQERDRLLPALDGLCARYGVRYFVEDDPLLTDLFPLSLNRGKYNVVFYREDGALREYLGLKEEKRSALAAGTYPAIREGLAWRYGRLLSYDEAGIRRLLAANTEREF